jgi:hypothetical protein
MLPSHRATKSTQHNTTPYPLSSLSHLPICPLHPPAPLPPRRLPPRCANAHPAILLTTTVAFLLASSPRRHIAHPVANKLGCALRPRALGGPKTSHLLLFYCSAGLTRTSGLLIISRTCLSTEHQTYKAQSHHQRPYTRGRRRHGELHTQRRSQLSCQ